MINVTICWAEASSYAAACFRALSAMDNVRLRVIHLELLETPPPWNTELFAHLNHRIFRRRDNPSELEVLNAICEGEPDIVVLAGWLYQPYVSAALHRRLYKAKIIVGMDTPWRNTLSQRLNRYRLRALVHRASRFIVAGDRSREYALRLGVPIQQIVTGYYGCDYTAFANLSNQRPIAWPRSFLFVGRYVAEKDLPTLVDAYYRYRESVSDPWSLVCTGVGPLDSWLREQRDIQNIGYTQPNELPERLIDHGVLVLPSVYEPWGVVVAEASASGMPVICSSCCGAGVDIVRPYYNGLIVPPKHVRSLAAAMRWMHDQESNLPTMGRNAQRMAAPFSAESWADRWYNYLKDVITNENFS